MKKNLFLLILIILSFGACTSLKTNLVSYEKNVELNDAIKVNFNKKLDKNSVNEKTVHLLYNNRKNKMEGHVIYIANEKQIQFIPAHSLMPSTEYELIVSSRVKYENGKDIEQEVAYKIFTRTAHNWERKGPPKRKETYLIKGQSEEIEEIEEIEETEETEETEEELTEEQLIKKKAIQERKTQEKLIKEIEEAIE